MADKKPTLKLWSVRLGKYVNYSVSIENGEIVATYKDDNLKFPGGITKEELLALVKEHNDANEKITALAPAEIQAQEDLAAANDALLESLK